MVREVRLEATVCGVSDRDMGVVILQDATDTELFQFGSRLPELAPGDRVRINRKNCLLRRRDIGVQISGVPVVDNNGIHGRSTSAGGVGLKKGRHSITVQWFNEQYPPSLEVKWRIPGSDSKEIPSTNLFHSIVDEQTGQEAFQPGLFTEVYEGSWERVPNFNLLQPSKTVVATNFDVGVRTRDGAMAVQFRGFFDAPVEGVYGFSSRSAAGSLLFVDEGPLPITKVGDGEAPTATAVTINLPLADRLLQQWVTVEGRVESIESTGRGFQLKLACERNSIVARILDGKELNASNLLNANISVTGIGGASFDLRGEPMLGFVVAASPESVKIVRPATIEQPDSVLREAEQVQKLSLDEARRQRLVRLKGVITSKGHPPDEWLSIEDNTRGIFVKARNAANLAANGDFCEIVGHSDAGDFAPIVVAEKVIRLGRGEFPEPAIPTWDELNNGSMDVQWVEIRGLVREVHSNTLSMLLPSGGIDIQAEGPLLPALKPLEKAVVKIRGVLFANWNAAREVRVGSVRMRNATVSVEVAPPADPFDAVLKNPGELLLFDTQATAFRRIKVRGQIVYADDTQVFLQQDGQGLRLLPAGKAKVKAGDLVEAAGYLSIDRAAMRLQEAVLRKTGSEQLPAAKEISLPLSNMEGLDSTRVRIQGNLLGWHLEHFHPVLEMQSGASLFLARLAELPPFALREGSELALEGVYAIERSNPKMDSRARPFELFVNSPADIRVLSQPSWWNLGRLLIVVGVLVVILLVGAIWITQLRRLVELRTVELKREVHERQRAEQQRALEVERSRIARDLHDDLGASLTEIAMLANRARRTNAPGDGVFTMLRSIGSKARELVAALDTIVWAVDPKDNSLQSVADYLCDFTDEYLSPAGIACRFDVPVALPPVVFEGRARHDLFLAVKETLNNIVRHAGATQVDFRITVTNGQLEIVIMDNGKGFDVTSSANGKGLQSLPVRLARIGGRHEVKSTPGKGTVVTIEVTLSSEKFVGPANDNRTNDI